MPSVINLGLKPLGWLGEAGSPLLYEGTSESIAGAVYGTVVRLRLSSSSTGTNYSLARIVYLVLLIAYASSIWSSIANGQFMDPMV